ncbi:MAG: LL-diaminopimelate aminotransferase [Chlamydiales bacterium]
MPKVNPHFLEVKREYIFPVIERKLEELKKTSPNAHIVNLGIGDVALPLAQPISRAICAAVEEMSRDGKVRGYGPSEGYAFLRKAIAENEYANLGISQEEIFISDGINSDIVNILDLFDTENRIGITDPTYPVYLDASVMGGRGQKLLSLPCLEENSFAPKPPREACDLIFLCSPQNPTGTALTSTQLKDWVEYAKKHKAILLFDAAYAAFITSPSVPKSIFEIEGAKEVAIEFRSFSKTAGFTGLRCGYTVLSKSLTAHLGEKNLPLHPLWSKRQNTKSNGVSYPIQRGAEAVYTDEGQRETRAQIASYLDQAATLRNGLAAMGYRVWGGVDSPYIWWKTPEGFTSWEFFDLLLNQCQIISVPGSGFGKHGEGYVRLSAFTTADKAQEALRRIARMPKIKK